MIYFSDLPRIVPYVPGAQNQHARVPKPIREKYGRDHDDDDADSHSFDAPIDSPLIH